MNPVLLQKQLVQNSNELRDYCKDLQSWGEEMKRKEEALNPHSSLNKPPPTPAKIQKPNSEKKPKKSKKKDTPKKKVGFTNYENWDRFDADAECDKLDESSDLTDECDEDARDEAIVQKEKGNSFVKSQKWNEAIECYTKAIECYAYDPVFFANRGLCYLKKGDMTRAEIDCTMSIKLDDTYVKAYQRRAASREAQNDFKGAIEDLTQVMKLEPNNKESQKILEGLTAKVEGQKKVQDEPSRPVSKFSASRNQKKALVTELPKNEQTVCGIKPSTTPPAPEKVIEVDKPKSVWLSGDDVIPVKAIKKPPHLRSTKSLKRIEIKDIEPTLMKEAKAEDAKPTSWPQPNSNGYHIKSDDFKVVEKKPLDNETMIEMDSTQKQNGKITDNSKNVETVLPVPKTAVQFYNSWKHLNDELKYQYLKRIDPKEIPTIFKESLEINVFSDILRILALQSVKEDDIFNTLQNLTKVKRFSTFTMFMSEVDKKNLWTLIDLTREQSQQSKEEIDQLVNMYEL